ncbi:MAG: glycosyltransferase [Puniceicoccales bacterium]|jgi:glycosyltransferase involved in cell wall biosynthesis|nr:glycosyltransferase [Puniceicoccales bacterium]
MVRGTPTYSLLVPVRNGERYLRPCLESVLRQDVEDWECLCVDGKSTDGTGDILRSFAAADERFIILDSSGLAVGEARNCGMERARGRWISFLDADDLLEPAFLRTVGQLARDFGAEISGCCHGNFPGDGEPIASPVERCFSMAYSPPLRALLTPKGQIFLGNGLRNHFVWGRLFERKFLQANGLSFAAVPTGEDTLFTLQAFHLAKRFALTERTLCWHRRHSQSLMNSYRCADYREHCIAVATAVRDWFRDRMNFLDGETARLLRRRIAKILYEGCLRGRHGNNFWASRLQSRRRLRGLQRAGIFDPSALLPWHRLHSGLFLLFCL